ncbi:MAG: hypothetical protein M1829_001649 [Trizodia sp. TS-e1964]|nr:MAG: hypothetical protein M1829_001649 [Trizodia sp. TS-e1964]
MAFRNLRGSCSCGRNQYTISLPSASASLHAHVFFDSSGEQRRLQAAPLTAWIRVPLSAYQSTTTSFFPDETHSSIRRVYSLPLAQHHFCGYCGTPLSRWSESPAAEKDFIALTLGSLLADDLHDLEDWGLLPSSDDDKTEAEGEKAESAGTEGLPWFETLIEGSRLGSVVRSMKTTYVSTAVRTRQQSEGGRVKVQWEIVEWEEEESGSGSSASAKRKIGEVDVQAGTTDADNDVPMAEQGH